ncbi:hypothetical protein [Parafrankia sp. FMc2]|uniref:hypothetical protein n=1 Tax=Parafrankia sp. FMc2 TaxID=3233196 RepID=UPI0034D53238
MSTRRAHALPRRLAGAVVFAFLLLILGGQPAAACDVSYQYRPSLDIEDLTALNSRQTCSTSTSLVGITAVALLAVLALVTAGAVVVRRGALVARARGGEDAVLIHYLADTARPLPVPAPVPAPALPTGPHPPSGPHPPPGPWPPAGPPPPTGPQLTLGPPPARRLLPPGGPHHQDGANGQSAAPPP